MPESLKPILAGVGAVVVVVLFSLVFMALGDVSDLRAELEGKLTDDDLNALESKVSRLGRDIADLERRSGEGLSREDMDAELAMIREDIVGLKSRMEKVSTTGTGAVAEGGAVEQTVKEVLEEREKEREKERSARREKYREQMTRNIGDHFARELSLTEPQRAEFDKLQKKFMDGMRDSVREARQNGDWTKMREKLDVLRKDLNEEAKDFLDSEQYEKYIQMQENMMSRGMWGMGGRGRR